jgi:predicted metal-binding membrane protein
MLLIGTASIAWMIAVAAIVVVYKLAPLPTVRWSFALAALLSALGVLYVLTAWL